MAWGVPMLLSCSSRPSVVAASKDPFAALMLTMPLLSTQVGGKISDTVGG